MLNFKLKMTNKRDVSVLPKKFKEVIRPAMKKVMLEAKGISKEKYFKNSGDKPDPDILTVRTGHLRRSIKSKLESRGSYIYASLLAGTNYAGIHEYGEGNIKARPFLQPAINDVIESDFMEKIILDEIDKNTRW